MTIIPGETPCYRCLVADVPEPGTMDTCDTAGVIAPAVHVVASLQAAEALRLLSGSRPDGDPRLTVVDVWTGEWRQLSLKSLLTQTDCLACRGGQRDFLRADQRSRTAVLCGRNAVQITPARDAGIRLQDMANRLADHGTVAANPFLLRVQLSSDPYEVTLFQDGRAIIQGTEDISIARSIYARYVGS